MIFCVKNYFKHGSKDLCRTEYETKVAFNKAVFVVWVGNFRIYWTVANLIVLSDDHSDHSDQEEKSRGH